MNRCLRHRIFWPAYERDRYWDEDLYDQEKLEHNYNHYKPNDRMESKDLITVSHASDALR